MNLYDLHKDPKSLHKHDESHDSIPELIFHDLMKGLHISDKQVTTLANNPKAALKYAVDYLRWRFKEAEPTLAKDPTIACEYARRALKGRFHEGEKLIATHPRLAYVYAREVIKGRWPEGEKAIATHPLRSRNYAVYVLKDKFPEGEEVISQSQQFTKTYNKMLSVKGYSDDDLIVATEKYVA